MVMLCCIQKVLPIGPDQWNDVLEQHNQLYPGQSLDSISRKLIKLHQKTIPTEGNHTAPLMRDWQRGLSI